MDIDLEMPKSPADLAELKEQIQAAVAGRLEGLDIDTPNHWRVSPVNDPASFFTHLGDIMPENSILFFEGTTISPPAQEFFRANRATQAVPVARDTIFPVPESFHVNYSPAICAGLSRLFQTHEYRNICNHIKGYASSALIFTLHDGFGNPLRISERVTESSVKTFAKSLSAECELGPTKPRDMQQLERFLKVLENDWQREKLFDQMRAGKVEPIKIPAKPWWARFWDKLRGQ